MSEKSPPDRRIRCRGLEPVRRSHERLTLGAAVALSLVLVACSGQKEPSSPNADVPRSSGDLDELGIDEALKGGEIRADPPRDARVAVEEAAIVLTWTGFGGHVTEFQVYRRVDGTQTWVAIGTVQVNGLSRGDFSYRDNRALSGSRYVFGVSARNEYGQESEIVESPPVTVP